MGLGWKELLVILVIVLLIFGTKRLKNIGGDLGEAVKGFKKGVKSDDAAPPEPSVRHENGDESRKD